jgi:hypothetical protein
MSRKVNLLDIAEALGGSPLCAAACHTADAQHVVQMTRGAVGIGPAGTYGAAALLVNGFEKSLSVMPSTPSGLLK